jgi:hypothetical protein
VKTSLLLGLLLAGTFASTPAPADDKAACADAALNGQTFRATHKLVEAREQLRACAQSACPALVQGDCAKWLDDVERALPTAVITAKDDGGRSVLDVRVSEDGRLLTSRLGGESLPLNPGVHTLHLERADGVTMDLQVVVKEGAKNQDVAVVLGTGGPPVGVPGRPSPRTSPWPTVGWVAGAVGIVGLGVGAAFGVAAISDKSSAHCGPTGLCSDANALSGAHTSADASTVAIVAGGVLVAGGAGLVLFAPKQTAPAEGPTATLRLAPFVRARDAGFFFSGAW